MQQATMRAPSASLEPDPGEYCWLSTLLLASSLRSEGSCSLALAAPAAPAGTNPNSLPPSPPPSLGGPSILGGTGGFAGTIVGAFILTVLNRLLTGLETTDAVRQIIYGVIVLTLAWFYVRITGQRAD